MHQVGTDGWLLHPAPYLVTAGKWKEYFETFGADHQLEGFGLRQSARELHSLAWRRTEEDSLTTTFAQDLMTLHWPC